MSSTKIDGKRQVKENTIDLDKLEEDFLKSTKWDINKESEAPGTITGIPDPDGDLDVANKRYVDSIVTSSSGVIGVAEDGTYTDGLFVDFEEQTPIGTAVDRFNELFKALAPSPAPNLSTISSSTSGTTGKLSFGTANSISGYTNVPAMDVGDTFSVSGTRRGIINASTNITGTLASDVTPNYTNNRPHPNLAFGDGDKGELHLELNGVVVHTVDLAAFGSGNSFNAAGSGFTLSASQAVQFDSGTELEIFQYRTGTFVAHSSEMRNGYNEVRVRHEYSEGLFRDTNHVTWVVDHATTNTSYSGTSLYGLNMSGANHISGVFYYTGGTANFDTTIANAFRNTYSSSGSAVSFIGTNCSASSQSLSTPSTEGDNVEISEKAVTVSSGSRLFNANISLRARTLRTLQGTQDSSNESLSGLLLDATSPNSSNTNDALNDERFRLHAGLDIEDTSYGSGGANASSYDWDSEESLVGANNNHNTGLLVANSALTYPSNTSHISGITNGDFQTTTTPANVDYSGASGNRTFIRYFYDSGARSNFRFNANVTGTSFVSVATGPSGNNLTFEVLAPNTTKDGNGDVEWKDAVVPHSGDDSDIGCYASTFGATIPTAWGCTIGEQNTSTSGRVIVVRITASSGWTGRINNLSITWL